MKGIWLAALILLNVILQMGANLSFKLSAVSSGLKGLVTWQAVGNVTGFIGVLVLTYVMKFLPLSQALAYSWGLGFIATEVLGARLLLKEAITTMQWLGVMLITAGVVVVSLGRPA